MPFRIFGLDDKDQDLVPERERLLLLRGKRGVLARRNDSLRLRPDVDQDFVSVDVHDGPVHDIPVFQGLVVMAGIIEELLHERRPEHVAIALSGDVRRRGSSSAGLSLLLANLRTVHTPSLVPTETRGLPCPCGSVLEPVGQERCIR